MIMNYEYGGSLVPFQGTHSPRQTVKPRNLTVRIAGNTAEPRFKLDTSRIHEYMFGELELNHLDRYRRVSLFGIFIL